MSVVMALVFMVSGEAADPSPTAGPATAEAPAPKKKEKKICKTEDASSGSRMAKRLCLTEDDWARRNHTMMDNARSGFSGAAEDH